MAAVAARHGYAGATVARVVDRAETSRARFYAHFAGREDCFLAAYRLACGRVRAAVAAVLSGTAPAARPAAVLDVLLEILASEPAAVRLVLVEALGAPPAARAEHERLLSEVDALVASFLDRQPPDGPVQIPAHALLGGVGEVLADAAVRADRVDRSALRAELLAWIDAYRLPAGEAPLRQCAWRELGRFAPRPATGSINVPALLPRGRSALPALDAAAARRRRLLDATAHLAAEGGYGSLSVARIAAAARCPRAAFYSHFEGKLDAVLAAQTQALQEAMGAAAAAYSLPGAWPERLRRAGESFLGYVATHPDYAHLDFVGSYAAGPEAVLARRRNHLVFALFLEDGYRSYERAASLPRRASEAIAGAVFGLMRQLVLARRSERMLSLLPAAEYVILAPFLGPEEAASRARERSHGRYAAFDCRSSQA
jgi:AcrR family transcriptional regulator